MKISSSTITTHTIILDDGEEVVVDHAPTEMIDPIISEDGNTLVYASDQDADDDYDGFGDDTEVYFIQFNNHFIHHNDDPESFSETYGDSHVIFPVNYSEHGLCQWSLGVAEKDWDTVPFAGLIAIPNDFADPEEAAKAFLEEYTDWCNGEIYGIIAMHRQEDGSWIEGDSCWGYIGDEHTKESMKEML